MGEGKVPNPSVSLNTRIGLSGVGLKLLGSGSN